MKINNASLQRALGYAFIASALLLAVSTAEAAAEINFDRPPDSQGLVDALGSAMNTWYYLLYLISPVTMYQAWTSYKEGDMKKFGAYLVGTIGIFLSPALPKLFKGLTEMASGQ